MLPFDARPGAIWLDGALVEWPAARVHYLTHGLHYASFVYEGIRVYRGRIFALDAHLERLVRSAELLGFALPWGHAELCAATERTVEAMRIDNGYIRPAAWRGSEMMQIAAPHARIHVAIAAWELPADFYASRRARADGIRMMRSRWARPAPHTAPVRSKAAGLYTVSTLAKHEALAAGYDDALLLDHEGNLAEGTGSNIFLVRRGKLHTPTPRCFLDGITRRAVMVLANQAGIEVIERIIRPEELADMEEAFLTGTATEITAIREIDDHRFAVGEVGRLIAAAYADRVGDR
jgi:branched-chain amino acid aminotransferase